LILSVSLTNTSKIIFILTNEYLVIVGGAMSFAKRLRRINISMMLRLVSFIFLIPIAYLLFYSILGYNGYIQFAQKEKAGAEVLKKIKPLIFEISEAKLNENLSNSSIDNSFKALISEFDELREELGLSVENMEKSDKTSISPENIFENWKGFNKSGISEADFNDIIQKLLSFNTLIGDVSNLILDPDLDSYYLMDIALLAMPQTTVRMFENQYYLKNNIDAQNINFSNRINLAVFNSSFKQSDIDRINGSMNTAFEQDEAFYGISNTLKPNLESKFDDFNKLSNELLFETAKAADTESDIKSNQIFDNTSSVLNSASALWDSTLDELIVLLDIRIDNYKNGRLQTVLIAVFFVILAYIALFFVSKNISNLIDVVMSFIKHISKGEVDEAINEVSLLESKYY
jgi:methyl-accepting chemotaxis protein